MTPEQISSIINDMPEGKRKRACVIISKYKVPVGFYSSFWNYISRAEYGKAAVALTHTFDDRIETDLLSDMIWEGGA